VNVLILGGAGMAGHVITIYLREHGYNVDTLAARNRLDDATYLLDVSNIQKLTDFLDSKQYDVIINCIASLVQQSEERKDTAAYLNAYLPHFLEHRYANTKTKIIHISSDGVFSGEKDAYDEKAAYDEQGFYGRSKAFGEIINSKDLTIRTSIIGPDLRNEGPGLFNWFYRQSGEISGYDKVLWQGVTTVTLAEAIEKAIEQNLTGIYHLVPSEHISKFDLLQLCKEAFGRNNISIKPNGTRTFKRNLINTRVDFDFPIPSYRDMIYNIEQWVDSHADLYPHYSYGKDRIA
jgi:dTDP-4-dehydrorhamnose reductase